MRPSAERIARNNATFRAANERIRSGAEAYGITEGAVPFICECASPDCTTVVHVPLERYRRVREGPRLFLLSPGHEVTGEGEGRVVYEDPGYVIFEKGGRAGELVEDYRVSGD